MDPALGWRRAADRARPGGASLAFPLERPSQPPRKVRGVIAQTNLQLERQLVAAGWSDTDLLLVAAGYRLAVRLFAGGVRSSGKPFLCHVVGTASLVARHDGAPPLVAAALVHAAYSHGTFGDGRAAGRTDRRADVVRAHVGSESESIVSEYHQLAITEEYVERLEATREPLSEGPRQQLVLLLANHTDDLLDGGIAVLGDAVPWRYQPPTVARLVEVARSNGLSAMADDLEDAARIRPVDVPPAFRRAGPKRTEWATPRIDGLGDVPWSTIARATTVAAGRRAGWLLRRVSGRT